MLTIIYKQSFFSIELSWLYLLPNTFTSSDKQTKHIRVWNDITGAEIMGFVGILLLQGEVKVGDHLISQSIRSIVREFRSRIRGFD